MCAQIGKKTEGEFIDLTPERKETFATATFDLEAIRWQRARCAVLLNNICNLIFSTLPSEEYWLGHGLPGAAELRCRNLAVLI